MGETFSQNVGDDLEARPGAISNIPELLEAAPDALVVVGESGRILLVNGQTERLFKYSKEDLLGRQVETLIPTRFRAGHPERRRTYLEHPHARAMGSGLELWGLRSDGTEFPIEISLSPVKTDAGMLVSSAIRDVTERRKADEVRNQLAAIVDSSQDAIIGKSLDGRICSWNDGAERIFGYTRDEILGEPVSKLLPPDHQDEELGIMERLKQGELVEPFETMRRCKDGRSIDVSITISPICDSRGKLTGASKVARDISERKQAEKEVARALEAAEMANRELEAFSYSVAHDLRAPLRAIDGFSQALLEGYSNKLDEEGQRYLRRVRSSAQRMAELIEDLLSLAHITRSEIRREYVDLSAIASKVGRRLAESEPERRVELVIQDELWIVGDKQLLAIALENLFGNAWKFTRNNPHAVIEFGLRQVANVSAFYVRDNGAGFNMAYSSKLFGVFQRLHTEREFEGTGIGLATVQKIIQRHDGRIWAEGEVGEGATFYFSLNEWEQLDPG